ncbi:MAG: LON peptidase substrate-binding domain-containing protein [Planctomycetota bacterium]
MTLQLPRSPVPIFPLRSVFLYPAQLLPLHIFEPRYRQMIDDSLDGHGRIVLGTIVDDDMPPHLLPVAGLGEIVRHEKLADGRFHIWLLGLARVRVREVESDRLYRKVECQTFEEVQAEPAVGKELKAQLRLAAQSRMAQKLEVPLAAGTGVLTDLLLQLLQLPQPLVQEIFVEPSVAARARMTLAAHERFPHSPPPSTDAI